MLFDAILIIINFIITMSFTFTNHLEVYTSILFYHYYYLLTSRQGLLLCWRLLTRIQISTYRIFNTLTIFFCFTFTTTKILILFGINQLTSLHQCDLEVTSGLRVSQLQNFQFLLRKYFFQLLSHILLMSRWGIKIIKGERDLHILS